MEFDSCCTEPLSHVSGIKSSRKNFGSRSYKTVNKNSELHIHMIHTVLSMQLCTASRWQLTICHRQTVWHAAQTSITECSELVGTDSSLLHGRRAACFSRMPGICRRCFLQCDTSSNQSVRTYVHSHISHMKYVGCAYKLISFCQCQSLYNSQPATSVIFSFWTWLQTAFKSCYYHVEYMVHRLLFDDSQTGDSSPHHDKS